LFYDLTEKLGVGEGRAVFEKRLLAHGFGLLILYYLLYGATVLV
jgi:hypothetical protein